MVLSTAVQAELQTVNDLVEDIPTSHVPVFNTSPPAGTNTCYNKFLLLYNLPIIYHYITFGEFLSYLRKHSFKHSFNISINYNKTELHIYTNPSDPILPEHKIIQPFQYELYKHLPLRTTPNNISSNTYPSSLDQLFLADSSLASLSTNLPSTFASNHTASWSETISESTSPNLIAETSTSNSYKPLHLSICTHNTRGYNDNLKQQTWEDYCLSHDINIASITETKISQNNAHAKFPRSQHFTYYWSCTDNCKAGTA